MPHMEKLKYLGVLLRMGDRSMDQYTMKALFKSVVVRKESWKRKLLINWLVYLPSLT